MVLQSQTIIKIGNKEIIDYKSLDIHQAIDTHHQLELRVRLKSLEPDAHEFSFESKKFLGERINVRINTLANQKSSAEFEFEGIITEIKNVKGTDDFTKDEVIFIAQSPTILLDDGDHYASYAEMSLTELVDKTILAYGDNAVNFDVLPMDDSHVYYSVQSEETSFQYLSRLAAQYGEWFYYNGTQLLFGAPGKEEVVLKRTIDLKSFDISLKPSANKYKYYNNDYLKDEVFSTSSSSFSDKGSDYNSFVNEKSQEMFDAENNIWLNRGSELEVKNSIEKLVEKQKIGDQVKQVRLSGVSDNPSVKLGNIVVIEGSKYRVVKIDHSDSKSGIYENRFEAVSADSDGYPKTNIKAFPKAGSQTAIVMDNFDPEGLGRITVQFPWQRASETATPWIRIVSQHAGADKGIQFIPEIGEEVLIGFEDGNAERPYMMGSVYHGKAKAESWGSPNNDIKAIRTRSGHMIKFDDKEGEESITIVDKSNNVVFIDTANSSIHISAPENISMKATNIDISATENLTMSAGEKIGMNSGSNTDIGAGENMNVYATEDLMIMAKNISEHANENMSTQASSIEETADDVSLVSMKEDIKLNSAGKIVNNSADKVKLF